MSKKRETRKWFQRHTRDPYVRQAQRSGYRSRASYKLLDVDAREGLLKPGQTVVDLGAAPGGWSQVAAERVGAAGAVVAVDALAMEPVPEVAFIQGDFTEDATLQRVLEALHGEGVDLVISDMAPNLSGNKEIDQPRAMHLAELALEFAERVLNPDGALVVKAFQGEGFEALRNSLKGAFGRVVTRKPQASRSGSRETYQVATGFHGGSGW